MDAAGHSNDDLVFVITRFGTSTDASSGCYNSELKNRIYGIWASTLTKKWTFNEAAGFKVGIGSEGCYIYYSSDDADPNNNTLYCGTDTPAGVTNVSSLWALDTASGAPEPDAPATSSVEPPSSVGGES